MSQQVITYRVAAISDAAGKYNPEAPFNGNEDNFYVDDNLSDGVAGRCRTDEVLKMGPLGCILVVADGMGGMNAGEVASEIAIDTVRQAFAPGVVLPSHAADADSRRRYLEHVVQLADRRIKEDASINPDHKGMGSTIIMAWIVGDKLTLTWCGDSRAYRYNAVNGLEALSTDHSYVQQLVNQGVISYEDTFEHPQGNIITRSLGDPNKQAVPESREFSLNTSDIILLCSDGLSGVLRDRLTYDHSGVPFAGEHIEGLMADNCETMSGCRDALMAAAKEADWYDNVTVLLCQIVGGAPEAVRKMPVTMPPMPAKAVTSSVSAPVAPSPSFVQPPVSASPVKPRVSRPADSIKSNILLIIIAAAVTLTVIAAGAWYFLRDRNGDDRHDDDRENIMEIRRRSSTLQSGGMGGLGISNSQNQNRQTNRESITIYFEQHSIASQDGDVKSQLTNAVNKFASEPLDEYAALIKEEIKEADFTKVDPQVFKPKIFQLAQRSEMVECIDGIIKEVSREDCESLESIREMLVKPRHINSVNLEEMQKAITEIVQHKDVTDEGVVRDNTIQPTVIE